MNLRLIRRLFFTVRLVSEFEAVLAAVYIAVKLKQEVSSDIDKNK